MGIDLLKEINSNLKKETFHGIKVERRLKMKQIIILILLLQVSLISAIGPVGENGLDISVKNNTIQIQGYTIIAAPPYGMPMKFVSTSGIFINSSNEPLGVIMNCVNFNYTEGNQSINIPTNCTYSIDYSKSFPFFTNFTNQSSQIVVDSVTQDKYEKCTLEKLQWESSYGNYSSYQQQITSWQTQLSTCQGQLTPLQTQNTELTKEQEDNKNKPWTYGGIGLAVGIIGTLFYLGRIGGPKSRRYEEDFNRGQSA
jgi:hypothetical protein